MLTGRKALGVVGAVVLAAAVGAAAAPGKLRVLLVSGQNNHDWRATTPALVKILEESGRFAVTVTNEPSKCTGKSFEECDVVVSNWTAWPNVNRRPWNEEAQRAFLAFIRGGGGLAVFHAASTACQDWAEFRQLACATWAKGKTGHGRRHSFRVAISEKAHPITAGMEDFEIFDELWHRMAVRPNVKVLCTAFSAKESGGSGAVEPVAMCTRLGAGRGFNLVLGHDVKAMSAPGWQALMLRGTEWAATGKVTIAPAGAGADLDGALKAVFGYRFGQSRKPLVAVEKLINAAAVAPASRRKAAAALAESLSAKATPDYKKFACRQLSLIAGDAEVPAIAALLGEKGLSLAARSALERMPGEAPLAALRAAMGKATGAARVGLICSLGERRDAKAVAAIAAVLADKDAVAAGAAIDALGKIGGPAAADALLAARDKLPAALRRRLADALLRCAEGLLADGKAERAAPIFADLSAAGRPAHVRAAAFPGLIACRKDQAADITLAALTGKDPAMQMAAVRAVRLADNAGLMRALADQLPKVAPRVRATIIETLGQRRIASALPAVLKQAAGEDRLVRRAALEALGSLGDAATAAALAKLAAEATGAEQAIARRGLLRLAADGVDEVLTGLLKSPSAGVRRESIAALRGRGARSALEAVLAAAGDDDPAVRTEAAKALGALGDLRALAQIASLLRKARSDADRSGLEQAVMAICRRGGAEKGVERILGFVDREDARLTASLLRILARLGGPKALKEIRKAVASSAPELRLAGIRALADWPDAAPLEDLLAAAKSAEEPVAKVLALRGFVKLSAKEADRKPAELAGLYARAMALARRAEEKKALLGGLGGVACPEALAAAEACMKEAPLSNEAALAVVRIAAKLWVSRPAAVKAALKRVCSADVARDVRAEATGILVELSKPINLARDATATSPDGVEKDGAAGGDQAAIDGNPGTYWDEADGAKLYRLLVTFPQPRKVAVIRITGYRHHNYAPKDFVVLCDGKVVKAVRNAEYTDNRLTVPFVETECKSLELKITGYYGQSPAVRELEIYAPDPGEKE